jgi:hypothetical protein
MVVAPYSWAVIALSVVFYSYMVSKKFSAHSIKSNPVISKDITQVVS